MTNIIQTLVEHLSETEPNEVDFQICNEVIQAVAKYYQERRKDGSIPELGKFDPDKLIIKNFYKDIKQKEYRFGVYNEMIHSGEHSATIFFWSLLVNDYSRDASNTPDQSELLERCKEEFTKELNQY